MGKVLDTDLKGVFLMAREVSTIMMKQKYGRIINISSVGGIQAGPAQVSYFAAKGGVLTYKSHGRGSSTLWYSC